jgi:hypothetical protein
MGGVEAVFVYIALHWSVLYFLYGSVENFLVPDWLGDIVDSGIGLLYVVPARQPISLSQGLRIWPLYTVPDAVENITVGKDSDVKVGGEDAVKGSNLFIPGIHHV